MLINILEIVLLQNISFPLNNFLYWANVLNGSFTKCIMKVTQYVIKLIKGHQYGTVSYSAKEL